MGDGQALVLVRLAPRHEDDVEVERPGSPARPSLHVPACRRLDALERVEQRAWRQVRAGQHGRVEERGLVLDVGGRRLVERGAALHLRRCAMLGAAAGAARPTSGAIVPGQARTWMPCCRSCCTAHHTLRPLSPCGWRRGERDGHLARHSLQIGKVSGQRDARTTLVPSAMTTWRALLAPAGAIINIGAARDSCEGGVRAPCTTREELPARRSQLLCVLHHGGPTAAAGAAAPA